MNIHLPNIYRRISLLIILFLSILITFNSAASEIASSGKVNEAIQIASKLHLKSKQLGFEWKMVKPYIDQAKEANKADDFQQALSLANQAIEHASLSIQQAKNAEKNWALAIPK